jgi:hypothetical protein
MAVWMPCAADWRRRIDLAQAGSPEAEPASLAGLAYYPASRKPGLPQRPRRSAEQPLRWGSATKPVAGLASVPPVTLPPMASNAARPPAW